MTTELIDRYEMLPGGCSVLCAVSGGADSVCLLHRLKGMEQERGIHVFAAHYEHGIRGEESLRDAAFVEKLCAELGVDCLTGHGNVPEYAAEHGMGIEEAARKLRYEFLNEAAERFGCSKIATAHNADDNAETVIFNLCRGSGSRGLRGIPPVRGNIIRPLLETSREEIEKYLEEHKLPHIEDSSNSDDTYSRNMIRHRVTPVLRSINPEFAGAVADACELLRSDEDCLEQLAAMFLKTECEGSTVPAKKLLELHPAVASRAVRMLCPCALSKQHTEAVMDFAAGTGYGELDLPGIRIRRERGKLDFAPGTEVEIKDRELAIGSETVIPELGVSVRAFYYNLEKTEKTGEIHNSLKTYYFKYESISGKVFCTGRKAGDRIRPVGRGCGKSLKQLFTEAGMTSTEKARTLVFRDEKGVLAVDGLAIDERCAAKQGDRVLMLEIKEIKKEENTADGE